MSDLFIEAWGTGAPVVLVHGSLATGAEEWLAQQPTIVDLLAEDFVGTTLPVEDAPPDRGDYLDIDQT